MQPGKSYQCFRGLYCHLQGQTIIIIIYLHCKWVFHPVAVAKQENALLLDLLFDPEEGGRMFLQNNIKLLPFIVTA
jgi:hypothetical protein